MGVGDDVCEAGELLGVGVGGREGGGGGSRADGVEELVDGGALVVDVGVVHRVHGE